MALPLDGVRILDVGTRIAAPFAATLLGDFGAEVIKVELPGSGDFMRGIGPFDPSGYSLWWAVEGRNKKSITLDLRRPRGQELFRRLARQADVVVENFQPRSISTWPSASRKRTVPMWPLCGWSRYTRSRKNNWMPCIRNTEKRSGTGYRKSRSTWAPPPSCA